jgi:hypothetical protein
MTLRMVVLAPPTVLSCAPPEICTPVSLPSAVAPPARTPT